MVEDMGNLSRAISEGAEKAEPREPAAREAVEAFSTFGGDWADTRRLLADARAEIERLHAANEKEECTPCECCASAIAERARAEAAERPLLQARAASEKIIRIANEYLETAFSETVDDTALFREIRTTAEALLASTSAPEGEAQNNSSEPIDNG